MPPVFRDAAGLPARVHGADVRVQPQAVPGARYLPVRSEPASASLFLPAGRAPVADFHHRGAGADYSISELQCAQQSGQTCQNYE